VCAGREPSVLRSPAPVPLFGAPEWHRTLVSSCHPLTAPPSHHLIVPSGCCVASCRAVVLSSRRPLTAPPSSCLIAQAGCCVTSHCAAISSSRRTALSSSRHPLTVLPSRRLIAQAGCCLASCCAVVSSSRRPLTPSVTRGALDDGGRCPPLPLTSNVVNGMGLAIASPLPSPSPWMLLLALQPSRRCHCSCHHRQCSFRCPPPSPTLFTVTPLGLPPTLSSLPLFIIIM